ncbi:hypothetical protein AC579_8681 [Pseudocercospora musae]|nr:hypothetical protein AC579_8681 [Pseudocercospora musae]KXT08214.1 hypothetical protein AC579_8681 [Pseudocercospora musae]
MINTAKEARNVVSFSKFPPQVIRDQGSAFSCFEFPGCETPQEYVKVANENIVVMVQTESFMGVENVEETCQVDGIEVIFNDLALDLLGHTPAKYTESQFLGAIDKIVETCRKFEKKVGILVANGEEARKAVGRFDFVAIGTDPRALQACYRQKVRSAKGGQDQVACFADVTGFNYRQGPGMDVW